MPTGITILLSMTVFLNLVAEKMPPTSEAVPLIGTRTIAERAIKTARYFLYPTGVLQGCIFGSLLFIIYTDEIPRKVARL